jgi:hypothetical protein
MGARIVGFMFYLVLSYGMVYFLLATKRSLGGWNTKEQLISPAIMAAIILIIAIGTVLVGPLPTVLLAVSLIAFAGYVRSSEALASLGVTAGDRASLACMLSRVIGSIGSLMQGLAMGSVRYGFGCARHPVFIAARRALAAGLARVAGAEFGKAGKLSESLPEDTARRLADQSEESEAVNIESVVPEDTARRLAGQSEESDAVNVESVVSHDDVDHTVRALADQGRPPPLSTAEEHGLDAVRAALGSPIQGRPLTRDQVKRLLECLEGR